DGNVVVSIFEATGRFDRWLAAHDAEIAVAALREAADAFEGRPGGWESPVTPRMLRGRANLLGAALDGGDSGGRPPRPRRRPDAGSREIWTRHRLRAGRVAARDRRGDRGAVDPDRRWRVRHWCRGHGRPG